MHFEVSVHFYTIHVCYNEIRMLKTVLLLGRDSSVGAATHYRLDGPGIESRGGGKIFCTHTDQPWGPPSLLYNGYWVSFPGVKQLGRGVNHPHPSSVKVKERVELYLFSPSGPSWPVHLYLYLLFKEGNRFDTPCCQFTDCNRCHYFCSWWYAVVCLKYIGLLWGCYMYQMNLFLWNRPHLARCVHVEN